MKLLYLLGTIIPSLLIAGVLAQRIGLNPPFIDYVLDYLLILNLFNPVFLYYAVMLDQKKPLVRSTFLLLGPLTLLFLGWMGLIGTEKTGFLIDPSFIDRYLGLSIFSAFFGLVLFYVIIYRGPAIKKMRIAKFFLTLASYVFLSGGILLLEIFHLDGFIFDPPYLKSVGELNPGGRTIRLIRVRNKSERDLAISEPLKFIPLNRVHGYLKYVCDQRDQPFFNPPPPPVDCPQLSVLEESGLITISDGENSLIF